MRRLLVLPLLVTLLFACDEDDSGGGGTGGSAGTFGGGFGNNTGSGTDNYPTIGCSSTVDGETSCVTTHAPLTQEQIDRTASDCTANGGTVMRDETCPRSPQLGCCISGAAGTRITTCLSNEATVQDLAKTQCEQSGGYWSTAIGDNPPASGTGAGGSGIVSAGKFINSCHQAAAFQCTGYTIQSQQIDDSCTQGGGVVGAHCPSAGLRGCCIQGGYAASCYYEGGKQTGEQSVEDFCKAGGSTFTATAP